MDSLPEQQPTSAWGSNTDAAQGPGGTSPMDTIETPPFPSAPERHAVPNRFFFGRFGLRAGYGILLIVLFTGLWSGATEFLALAASGVLPELRAARAYAHAHPNAPRLHVSVPSIPTLPIVSDGVLFLGLLGFCWLLSRRERRPLRVYGLGAVRAADALPGAFWGLVVLSALVATLRGMHLLVFDGRALYGSAALLYGAKWLLAFLMVGFAEEYLFRGYIQFAFLRGFWGLAERIAPANTLTVAFLLASATTSLIFAYTHSHNPGENLFGLFQVFVAGVTFVYALWRTGSLWWGIGFHTTWDWAQSYLFGVADSGQISVGRLFITHPQGKAILSGGTAGPEGSIFATVALLLTIAIIRFTTRPGMQPTLEQTPKLQAENASVLHNAVA